MFGQLYNCAHDFTSLKKISKQSLYTNKILSKTELKVSEAVVFVKSIILLNFKM